MPHLWGKRPGAAAAIVCVCLAGSFLLAEESKKEEKPENKMRHRLEQLFIWRVADRLGLTTQEEARFNEEFTKLSHEKLTLSQKLDTSLEKIEQAKGDKKAAARLLSEYQSTLKKYSELQSRELEVIGKILGTEKMVEYVLLKREMTQKFKDVLVQGPRRGAENASLKDPEVIQEK